MSDLQLGPDGFAEPYLDSSGKLVGSRPSAHQPPAPSSYRFTVSVERRPGAVEGKWRTHINEDGRPFAVMSAHDTEAEARSHAAQVLAALHQATMEETP